MSNDYFYFCVNLQFGSGGISQRETQSHDLPCVAADRPTTAVHAIRYRRSPI